MNIKHTTRDGRQIFISEMDDKHLENTIKLILSKIEEAKSLLINGITKNKFKDAVYGTKKTIDEDDLADFIQEQTSALAFYLMESQIRGVNYTLELQRLFERSSSDIVKQQLLLPTNIEDFDENW